MQAENVLDQWQGMVAEAETSIHYWMHGPVVELTEDLSRRMKEQKISRAELARRMGTSRAYITKLLSGDANFTLQTMVKLALAVNGVLHLHIADKDAATQWNDQVPPAGAAPAATVAATAPEATVAATEPEAPAPPKARKKARTTRA